MLPSERHALSYRFEHRCAICRALLPTGWHTDHIVALANGGPDEPQNMQPLCPSCHTLKTARENSERGKARPQVGLTDPHPDERNMWLLKCDVVVSRRDDVRALLRDATETTGKEYLVLDEAESFFRSARK